MSKPTDAPPGDYVRQTREAYLRVRRQNLRCLGDPQAATLGANPIPCWDGGRDAHGRTRKPVWTKLAKFLLDHQCAPELFIRAQLTGAYLPQPLQMCSELAIQRYQKFQVEHRRQLHGLLASHISSLRSLFTVEQQSYPLRDSADSLFICLMDPDMTDLFRFSMVSGFPALHQYIPQFEVSAIEQYAEDPEGYADSWKIVLPAGFVEYANQKLAVGARHG